MTQQELIERIEAGIAPITFSNHEGRYFTAYDIADWIAKNFEPKKPKTLSDLLPGDLIFVNGSRGDTVGLKTIGAVDAEYLVVLWDAAFGNLLFQRTDGKCRNYGWVCRIPTQEEIDAHHAKEARAKEESLRKKVVEKIAAISIQDLERVDTVLGTMR